MERPNSIQLIKKILNKMRNFAFFLIPITLTFIWACIQRPMRVPVPDGIFTETFLMPQSAEQDVDILFLVDSSGSMKNEQENLKAQFVSMMNVLKNMKNGLPNVHIGVITPDLGTGNITNIPGCMRFGGDGGILGMAGGVDRGEICIGPGQRYIVDMEPAGCRVDRDPEASHKCLSHDCVQAQCEATAGPGETLTLVVDEYGCPRCRNYGSIHATLEETFQCLADVGYDGCGFEQQLEAVRKALTVDEVPENTGFLRESAYLSLILITDEDDCSAASPETLFNSDTSMDDINSSVGVLDSFRCFEFGVTCDINDRTVSGPRNQCVPNDDPSALLHTVDRYTSLLEDLKDPTMLIVGSISGPVEDQVMVNMVSNPKGGMKPAVGFSCQDPAKPDEGARPGIRLRAFVEHFNSVADMGEWAYTSVCNPDFTPALIGIANKIKKTMENVCPANPFAGCAKGPDGTVCSPCLPECVVFDIENKGQENQKKKQMPWCGRVCLNGLCTQADLKPCNYNEEGRCTCEAPLYPTKLYGEEGCAPLLYRKAQPELKRDATLASILAPVEPSCVGPDCGEGSEGRASACWYLSKNVECGASQADFRVVRADDPPPRTFTEGRCKLLPNKEIFCHDGNDNDGDCLIDAEDPDCAKENSDNPLDDPSEDPVDDPPTTK